MTHDLSASFQSDREAELGELAELSYAASVARRLRVGDGRVISDSTRVQDLRSAYARTGVPNIIANFSDVSSDLVCKLQVQQPI